MKALNTLALTTALSLALMAPAAMAADLTPVERVKVESDVTAIANERAASYWGKLADDLQAAILARVQDRIADKGSRISVDVNEVSLANSFESVIGTEDSVLVGNVNISSDDNSKFDSYELAVSINAALPLIPERARLVDFRDSPEHYRAMVDTFAAEVVARLK